MRLKPSISIHGDALKVLKQIPDASIDACITDPPYNMSKKKGLSWAFSSHVTMQENWDQFSKDDYFNFSVEWIRETTRVLKPNGNLLIFGTYHNIYTLGFVLGELDRRVLNSIIWTKPNAQPNITCRMLTQSTEQVIWACNERSAKASGWTFNYALAKKMNGGKQLRNYWSFPVTPKAERVAGHPTQKPYQLMERLVLLFSNRGDTILDPFAGVGTTGVASLSHGRRFVMIEKQKKFVSAQQKRIKASKLPAARFTTQYPVVQKSRKRTSADATL